MPSTHLKKFFTRLKIVFDETVQEYFLSSNFDIVLSAFFVNHLDGKLALFENLQKLLQYHAGPQLNWKNPSLYWKSFFMELHKSIFWARTLTSC